MSEGHSPRSFSALGSLSVSQVPSSLSGSFKEQYVQNKGENNKVMLTTGSVFLVLGSWDQNDPSQLYYDHCPH